MTDLAADLARQAYLVEYLTPRHERPIPFCPHTPHPKQREFLSLDCLEALYGGAAAGGKSDALLMAALMYVDLSGYSALILRRTFKELDLTGAIMDRARSWLVGRPGVQWSEVDKRFTFPSGATLTFGYCSSYADAQQYKSAEFQFIGIDELTDWEERTYTFLFSRLRKLTGVAIPLRMRGATNPGGIGHEWVKARFVKNEAGKPTQPFVPARLDDNEHADRDSYLMSLSKLDDEQQRQYRDGEWILDPSGLQFAYLASRNSVLVLPPRAGYQVTFSIDYGSAEHTASSAFSALWWHPHDPSTYVERAWAEAALISSDFAARVIDYTTNVIEPAGATLFSIVSDEGALGQSFGREMRKRHNLAARPAKKTDRLGNIKLFNSSLKDGSIKVVAGACDDLVAEFSTLRWNPARTACLPGQANHVTDSVRYGWRDSQAFRATAAPSESPVYGSPEWLAQMEARAVQREIEADQQERSSPWETW